MSRNSLLILLVVALLVGVAALFTQQDKHSKDRTDGARAPGTKLLAGFDPSAMSAVAISTPDGNVTINRGANDVWSVAERDGYQADATRLSGLVRSLLDLKILQVQEAGPSQYPRLQLADPATTDEKIGKDQKGTVVRLLDEKKATLAEVVFGKAPQSGGSDPMAAMMGGASGPGGKFARLGGQEKSIYLLDQSPYQATGNPADWVDKKFLQPGGFKSLTITGGEGFQGWEVSRDKADGTFVLKNAPPGKQLAASTNSALTSFLSYAQAADVLTKAEVDSLDRKASRTVKAETFDGLSYEFTLTPLPQKEGDNASPSYAVETKISGSYAEPAPPPGAKKTEEMNEEEKKADADVKAAARKAWDEKLAREQAIADRVFKLNSYTVEAVWKAGNEVVEDIPAPPPAPEGTPPEMLTPPPAGAEPASAATPPVTVTTEPIEVSTAAGEETARLPEPAQTSPAEEAKPSPQETPPPAKAE